MITMFVAYGVRTRSIFIDPSRSPSDVLAFSTNTDVFKVPCGKSVAPAKDTKYTLQIFTDFHLFKCFQASKIRQFHQKYGSRYIECHTHGTFSEMEIPDIPRSPYLKASYFFFFNS